MIRQRQLPRRPCRRQRRSHGFSLIEVVIAAGIFALVAGLLFATLWSGQGQVARLARAGGEDERLLATRRILSSWLEAATVAGTEIGADLFRGEPELMVFNATPADRRAADGLYRIEISIERSGDDRRPLSRLLVRRQRLGLAGTPGGDGAAIESSELLVTTRRLSFVYGAELGTGPNGVGQRWSDTWPEPSVMPTRVQVLDGTGMVLSAAVAITKDPRCVLRRGPQMLAGGECLVR